MTHQATLLMAQFVTHDVKRFLVSKPEGFAFTPGQGVELVIDQDKWRDEDGRPFTPTSLASDRILEFLIKRYPDHKGVTEKLHTLAPGARLLLSDPFGTIAYRGPGVFIAGGAGITPFLAIIRQLAAENRLAGNALLFSNKTPQDVICEKELRHAFGDRCHLICTRQQAAGYDGGRIDRNYLERRLRPADQFCYVCGPELFVTEMAAALKDLGRGAESIVFEE
ncbi:MAG: FAD-binding oxidoreductase [Thermodesulfobacteriota bacterium]